MIIVTTVIITSTVTSVTITVRHACRWSREHGVVGPLLHVPRDCGHHYIQHLVTLAGGHVSTVSWDHFFMSLVTAVIITSSILSRLQVVTWARCRGTTSSCPSWLRSSLHPASCHACRWSREHGVVGPLLHVPRDCGHHYIQHLVTLAGGHVSTVSWDHFFVSLNHYYMSLRQEAPVAADMTPLYHHYSKGITPQEVDGLTVVLKLIRCIAEQVIIIIKLYLYTVKSGTAARVCTHIKIPN